MNTARSCSLFSLQILCSLCKFFVLFANSLFSLQILCSLCKVFAKETVQIEQDLAVFIFLFALSPWQRLCKENKEFAKRTKNLQREQKICKENKKFAKRTKNKIMNTARSHEYSKI